MTNIQKPKYFTVCGGQVVDIWQTHESYTVCTHFEALDGI